MVASCDFYIRRLIVTTGRRGYGTFSIDVGSAGSIGRDTVSWRPIAAGFLRWDGIRQGAG